MGCSGKITVALSGGVDSSVAALLLQQQGYFLGVWFVFVDTVDRESQEI